MRNIAIFIFIALSLAGCRKHIHKKSLNDTVADTVSVAAIPQAGYDTVVKTSSPFKLNGTQCYWKHSIVNDDEIIIEMLDHKTDRILLEGFNFIYLQPDYNAPGYFDDINSNSFADVNFDGFTDVLITNYGSGPINDHVYIYLFDKEANSYAERQDLSDNRIAAIDAESRKLITTNAYRYGTDSTVNCFDKVGKLKFMEVYSAYMMMEDTAWVEHTTYSKTINGKIVKERTSTDTIMRE